MSYLICLCQFQLHCSHKQPADVLKCLKNHVDQAGFDPQCKKIVLRRAMESTKGTHTVELDIPCVVRYFAFQATTTAQNLTCIFSDQIIVSDLKCTTNFIGAIKKLRETNKDSCPPLCP